MKRLIGFLLCCLLVLGLTVPALAAGEEVRITLEPQSPYYQEYAIATYRVVATGKNLRAFWYLEWEGKVYDITDTSGAMQPWEVYAGETYGAVQVDDNTFEYFFGGIEVDLDGAYIWCVVEDGHFDAVSQKTRVSVGNDYEPPVITDIPARLTVEQGEAAEIQCIASGPDGSKLSYIWYETPTGKREDIVGVDDGAHTTNTLVCDTSTIGTRNYLCAVSTSDGGMSWSSIVPVTVVEKTQVAPMPEIQTETLPEAVTGTEYSTKISCSDPEAKFTISYNPGKENDFEKTGLTLNSDGTITGTPKAVGSYTFCVCASGAGGEDYMVYTLTVKEPAAQPPIPTDPSQPSQEPTTAPTDAPKEPVQEEKKDEQPWWIFVLVAVVSAGAGIGVAILLVKKKS